MWLDITDFDKEWSREMYLFQIGLKLGVPDKPIIFFFSLLYSIYFFPFIFISWRLITL